jgi:hypothetical protein
MSAFPSNRARGLPGSSGPEVEPGHHHESTLCWYAFSILAMMRPPATLSLQETATSPAPAPSQISPRQKPGPATRQNNIKQAPLQRISSCESSISASLEIMLRIPTPNSQGSNEHALPKSVPDADISSVSSSAQRHGLSHHDHYPKIATNILRSPRLSSSRSSALANQSPHERQPTKPRNAPPRKKGIAKRATQTKDGCGCVDAWIMTTRSATIIIPCLALPLYTHTPRTHIATTLPTCFSATKRECNNE